MNERLETLEAWTLGIAGAIQGLARIAVHEVLRPGPTKVEGAVITIYEGGLATPEEAQSE